MSDNALLMRLLISSLLAAVALLAPGTGHAAVTQSPPSPVVGAGAIDVPLLRVYSAPRPGSRVVATLTEFRTRDFRPSTVLALDVRDGHEGSPAWYRIPVPGRPNGRSGWVRASQVSIKPMPWQVVVFRGSKVLQVWKGDRKLLQAKVAVGAPGMETPTGIFYVTVRFKPVRQTFLGAYAFETSAYSKLSEWPGGGVVGLHGTWQPWLLGKQVSHGCVRISNETANFLRSRIPVGTPIRIVAA